jgi:DNA-binding CsgD family transcriptional regulator
VVRVATGFLASTYIAQSALARAEALLNAALDPATPTQTLAQRQLWCAQAELALARGDSTLALQIVTRLIESAAHVEQGGGIPRLWRLHGVSLAALDRLPEAEAALCAAQAAARAQGARSLLWRIQVSLGNLYHTQGRREAAEEAAQEARAMIEELAADLTDELAVTLRIDTLRDTFLQCATAQLPRRLTSSPRRSAKRSFGGLTEREREVAAFIAQGKINREIAETLVVGERTIETHVGNILSKLGFTSRRQIAAWAIEKGLTAEPQEH